MPAVAKVVIDIFLDRQFDYLVPSELKDRAVPGSRVLVPFGRSVRNGFVVALADRSSRTDLKKILEAPDDFPLIAPSLLELARWMGEYYCVPVEQAVRSVLPAAVRDPDATFRTHRIVRIRAGAGAISKLPGKQQALLDLLTGSQAGMPVSELLDKAGTTSAPLKALQSKGLVDVLVETVGRPPLAGRNVLRTGPLELMPEQNEALVLLRQIMDAPPGVLLLHGVTGSGKTEVYLQAIEYAIRRGQGAIVLVPEISLTPQTVDRFLARFGNKIAVLHSHLSDGERHDEWYRIRNGEADIVVGARSAVFAPVRNLGLIVVDEEHEPSYKQEDSPRYHARDVAVMRGHISKCAVLLCSATPSLESWENVKRGKYGLASLPRRADDRQMPCMRIVDMRVEAERAGHACVFSRDLLDAMRRRLDRGEQIMLFLNRRGYASSMLCPFCGHVETCRQCSVSCTYHKTDDTIRCHVCGDTRKVPAKCPQCGDSRFRMAGIGTQRVEQIVRKCFPKANVERMDADATRRKDAYDRILGGFRTGKTDILIGTQMIAKGLHFPNVTLVGVVCADLSLYVPDFRAGERTFQLLAQVAGRAGRGDVPGEVVVQTYTPAHQAIRDAMKLDFDGFAKQELASRRELSYPPFAHLVQVGFRGRSERQTACCAEQSSKNLRAGLQEHVIVSEGVASPLARAKGFYRYQVLLRGRSVREMVEVLRRYTMETRLPSGVRMTVDVDAVSIV